MKCSSYVKQLQFVLVVSLAIGLIGCGSTSRLHSKPTKFPGNRPQLSDPTMSISPNEIRPNDQKKSTDGDLENLPPIELDPFVSLDVPLHAIQLSDRNYMVPIAKDGTGCMMYAPYTHGQKLHATIMYYSSVNGYTASKVDADCLR